MYDSVMVLRCLHLKETQPAQWQQLMKLQSHSDQRKQSGLEDMDRNVIVRYTMGMHPYIHQSLDTHLYLMLQQYLFKCRHSNFIY